MAKCEEPGARVPGFCSVVLTGPSSKDLIALVNRLRLVPPASPEARPSAPTRAFRFTAAQTRAVVEAYEAGATMASLAKQYGVKRETISKLLRREGVSIRERRVISEAENDQAVRLYAQGLSSARIADQLHYDQATIYRALKKRGVVMRSPNDRGLPDGL